MSAPGFRCDSLLSRAAAVLMGVLLFAGTALPVSAVSVAPANASAFLRTRDAASVTRGEFLRAAIKALGITLPKGRQTLPYQGVPSTLRAFVQAAHADSALKAFGKDLQLQKAITRGEAIMVLADLLDDTPKSAKFSYSDVRGADNERAVGLALERNWLKASGSKVFGMTKPLKGKEAKLLLQRLQRSEEAPSTETFTVPIIRVNDGSRSLPKEDVLKAIWGLLQDEYLYKEKLDGNKAMDKSIDALVQSLQDPYTTYMPATSTQNFQNQLKGEVQGIGATVELTGGFIVIVAPLKGSPAEKAGLLPKDKVIAVDDALLTGLSLDEAVSKIRGPKGTNVKLKIDRDGVQFDVTVTRDKVTIPEVEISMQDNVAVVKIYQFGQTTDTALRAKMQEITQQSPRGIVLDLRNNPGGLLHAASSVVGLFVPKNSIYASIMARESTTSERTEEEPVVAATVPLVVLVNEGSASASEIVAGALQDAKRATLVGKKTFGKGTVQQIVQFTDGSSLKMTIAEWRTPGGRKIDGVGIEPDYVVENTGTRDDQMLRALELAR